MSFLNNQSRIASPIPCSFVVTSILSMKSSLASNENALLLSLLVSGLGSNPITLLALYPKDLTFIGQSIELFMHYWCSLQGSAYSVYGALCEDAFRSYLFHLPFSHSALRQLSRSTLFFNQLLRVYGRCAARA